MRCVVFILLTTMSCFNLNAQIISLNGGGGYQLNGFVGLAWHSNGQINVWSECRYGKRIQRLKQIEEQTFNYFTVNSGIDFHLRSEHITYPVLKEILNDSVPYLNKKSKLGKTLKWLEDGQYYLGLSYALVWFEPNATLHFPGNYYRGYEHDLLIGRMRQDQLRLRLIYRLKLTRKMAVDLHFMSFPIIIKNQDSEQASQLRKLTGLNWGAASGYVGAGVRYTIF